MSSRRSHTFCFMLPVRVGVFIVSILFLLGSTIAAAIGWYGVMHREKVHMTKNHEASVVISSISHTILAIVSLFGLIGAINKRRSFVSVYSSVMAWHLGFSLASSAFFIYALFHKIGKHDMNHCLSRHSNDSNKDEECRKEFHYYRGAIIVLIVIFWLLELWGWLITSDYVSQLKEEEPPAYPPPAEIAATAPPLATTYNYRNQYSFSAPENSFGQGNVSRV